MDPLKDEDLSALADGELSDPDAVRRVCAHWHENSDTRATWHAYQLLGDVLRSEDLASAPGHDSEFLAKLRVRLAQQPVVLAPEPLSTEPPQREVQVASVANGGRAISRPWRVSAAVTAGFVAVAGAVVVFQMNPAGGSRAGTADVPVAVAAPASAVASPLVVVSAIPTVQPSVAVPDSVPDTVLSGRLVRDARLDEYLAAHKKFGGSSAPGGPSGFLRNAAVEER